MCLFQRQNVHTKKTANSRGRREQAEVEDQDAGGACDPVQGHGPALTGQESLRTGGPGEEQGSGAASSARQKARGQPDRLVARDYLR